MQPYFAPYLGYFDLIRRTDEWVVFICTVHPPRLMNRNRLLKQGVDIMFRTLRRWRRLSVPNAG